MSYEPTDFISPYKEPAGTKLDYDNLHYEAIILEKNPKITERFCEFLKINIILEFV